ncbi:hypothetical protein QE405_002327 [Nocardioides zeae]|uniref:Uncharacterized protein n=1 Tax=Nocardioides zeae TaxID=1457234 RepID=A0AAJ1U4M0_9ACTN|nr:hypothetical protein [Nocardioides zeae]
MVAGTLHTEPGAVVQAPFLGVRREGGAPLLLDVAEEGEVDAGLVDDEAARVGARDDGAAELVDLRDGVDGDVPRAGDDDAPAVERRAPVGEHLLGEVDEAVAGRLGTHLRAAPGDALPGEHAGLVAVGDPLVLTEEVADLAAAHADVAGRDVGVLADVAVELRHEGLAEPHDLARRPALRVEVGAALAAADGQAGERVLEDLLEAEELHRPREHGRVEAQAALVGAEGRVELHPEAAVDLHAARVVDPRHAEDDLALRLAEAREDAGVGVLRVAPHDRPERAEDLAHGLMELQLTGVAAQHLGVGVLQVRVQLVRHGSSCRRRSSGGSDRR